MTTCRICGVTLHNGTETCSSCRDIDQKLWWLLQRHQGKKYLLDRLKLKVFTSTDFEGHWPVGTAAVVVAASESEAMGALANELYERGMPNPEEFTLQEVALVESGVVILQDGNY